MAMNASVLGALMKSNVDALSVDDLKGRTALFEALAAAVIEHIQTTATIAGLVVTGTAGPVPVTGTAVGAPGSIQ